MPVILAIWEAEIRWIEIPGLPKQKVHEVVTRTPGEEMDSKLGKGGNQERKNIEGNVVDRAPSGASECVLDT
jgi:hypothetical protein